MIFAVLAVLLSLSWDRVRQVEAIRSASAEQYGTFAGGFDPRPVLDRISQSGYRICYADYWIAYKLEWVSEQRVLFIPLRSYDRNRPRSRALATISVPKCFVDRSGAVRPFPADEAKPSSP